MAILEKLGAAFAEAFASSIAPEAKRVVIIEWGAFTNFLHGFYSADGDERAALWSVYQQALLAAASDLETAAGNSVPSLVAIIIETAGAGLSSLA